MRISFISDTHGKHYNVTKDLRGGDLIIHAGDVSSLGTVPEVVEFCKWFSSLNYTHKIFIAGNHELGFQDTPKLFKHVLEEYYADIVYLKDEIYVLKDDNNNELRIWGSPWTPRFYDWAFNADRGLDIKQYWDMIPDNIDILITHGPPWGILDTVERRRDIHLGCEDLALAVGRICPKFHVFGHIHTGNGIITRGDTTFINAAVLNEQYEYAHKPITIDYDLKTNTYDFIKHI